MIVLFKAVRNRFAGGDLPAFPRLTAPYTLIAVNNIKWLMNIIISPWQATTNMPKQQRILKAYVSYSLHSIGGAPPPL